eukprot:scaffold518_cov388-Prasinococcus_capsulatus_cf.AAC.40
MNVLTCSNCCEDGECPPPPDIVLDLPPPPDVLPMPPPPDVLLLAPPPAASCEGLCGPNGSPDGVCFCDALCLVLRQASFHHLFAFPHPMHLVCVRLIT